MSVEFSFPLDSIPATITSQKALTTASKGSCQTERTSTGGMPPVQLADSRYKVRRSDLPCARLFAGIMKPYMNSRLTISSRICFAFCAALRAFKNLYSPYPTTTEAPAATNDSMTPWEPLETFPMSSNKLSFEHQGREGLGQRSMFVPRDSQRAITWLAPSKNHGKSSSFKFKNGGKSFLLSRPP